MCQTTTALKHNLCKQADPKLMSLVMKPFCGLSFLKHISQIAQSCRDTENPSLICRTLNFSCRLLADKLPNTNAPRTQLRGNSICINTIKAQLLCSG